MSRAEEIIKQAADNIGNRAGERDQEQERSMARTVEIFNAMRGKELTELDGWWFMMALKAARAAQGKLQPDDYIDISSYAGLAGECAEAETKLFNPDAPILPIDLKAATFKPTPFVDIVDPTKVSWEVDQLVEHCYEELVGAIAEDGKHVTLSYEKLKVVLARLRGLDTDFEMGNFFEIGAQESEYISRAALAVKASELYKNKNKKEEE